MRLFQICCPWAFFRPGARQALRAVPVELTRRVASTESSKRIIRSANEARSRITEITSMELAKKRSKEEEAVRERALVARFDLLAGRILSDGPIKMIQSDRPAESKRSGEGWSQRTQKLEIAELNPQRHPRRATFYVAFGTFVGI
jgi:hypothetical protein